MLRLLLWGVSALCVGAAAQPLASDPTAIIIDSRELWKVKAPRAGVDATDRAADVRDSIIHLAESSRRTSDDVREVHLDTESILLVSRTYIFSVTDEDARIEKRSRSELFASRKQLVLETVARYRAARRWSTLFRASGLAVAALAAAVLLLIALWLACRVATRRISKALEDHSSASSHASWVRLFKAPLLLASRLVAGIGTFVLASAIVTTAGSFALGLFPATSGVSRAVISQIWVLLAGLGGGLVAYLPNLLVLVLIAVSTYSLAWTGKTVAHAINAGDLSITGVYQDWAMPTYSLLRVLLLLFALVVAFPYLPGGESPALKGASIFIGVLVSLGSGSAMGNVIAGVILIYMRPFRVGDRVQIADTVGDVLEKSFLVTRIKTIKNVEVILPNSEVLGAHILNYSAQASERGLILHTTVTLGYDAPWRTVNELMVNAALRTEGILSEPSPFVLQTSLNDFHISYELNAYTNVVHQMAALYSDLHKNIQEEFNARGVEIMSPTYLAIRDGNTVTIPAGSRPESYEAPFFRISVDSVEGHRAPAPHFRAAKAGSAAAGPRPPGAKEED